MPVILEFQRQRQKDIEFKVIFSEFNISLDSGLK